jgi:diguanylate cyclase (GGDEF)-like protein
VITPPKPGELPKILLVEDSQTTRALLSKYLAGYYELLHAPDGKAAWELLSARTDIELVITDIQMPRMTGQQLLVAIRKSNAEHFRNLPVIVMTTADDNTDRNLAFLNGANDFLSKPIDEFELQARVNVHHKLARTIRELEASRYALAQQATTDPLTQLKNRRAFFDNAEKFFSQARRYHSDLSVMLLDIDHFKRINDTHGHHGGDEALSHLAAVLSQMIRSEDTVARIGGEEFGVLMPDTNRLGAAVLAERMRAAAEREPFVLAGRTVHVTVSIGIASFGPDGYDSFDQLMSAADRRLYLAKSSGRNRICVNDDGRSSFAGG